jgi:hypothetical protein
VPTRFRVRSMLIVIASLALLAAFFRPDAHHDPAFLSAMYAAILVAGCVQLLIYAIGRVPITNSRDVLPESEVVRESIEAEGR